MCRVTASHDWGYGCILISPRELQAMGAEEGMGYPGHNPLATWSGLQLLPRIVFPTIY